MKSKRKRGGNIKREKILDMAQKMRLKRKTRKISVRRKKHSDMIISNRFENPIFAIRKWLLPPRFYQGPGSLALPRGEVGGLPEEGAVSLPNYEAVGTSAVDGRLTRRGQRINIGSMLRDCKWLRILRLC